MALPRFIGGKGGKGGYDAFDVPEDHKMVIPRLGGSPTFGKVSSVISRRADTVFRTHWQCLFFALRMGGIAPPPFGSGGPRMGGMEISKMTQKYL